MNSSAGFKKRNLLRPQSGVRQREREYLKIFDLSQAEPMISNQIKSQLIRIQQEINELDKDKKIRSSESSSLQKSFALTLKKWLRQSSTIQQKQDDDVKIMKYMGVDSYEGGFRKLWKILSSLDMIVTKITELQIIQLLKYDELFDELGKDSQKASIILSTLSKAGFTSGTFQVSQVLLQRNKDIYSSLLEYKRKGSVTFVNSQKQNKKQQASQLINQLKNQNAKLSDLLEELEKEKENNKILMKQLKSKQQIIKNNQNIFNNSTKPNLNGQSFGSSNPTALFKQLQEKYTERIAYMASQINKLQSLLSEQKITISSLQTKIKLVEEDLKEKYSIKHIITKSGSYEEALLEEMEKMKSGFEKKIQKLLGDHAFKQKEMRKKEIDFRNQNQKLKWQKNLLLKKFQALDAVKVK